MTLILESLGVLATFAILVGVAIIVARSGGAGAMDILSRANEALRGEVERIRKELAQVSAELSAATTELGELRGKTDVVAALAPMMEWATGHEARAGERAERLHSDHLAMLDVLGMIGQRLGPDPNGHGAGG